MLFQVVLSALSIFFYLHESHSECNYREYLLRDFYNTIFCLSPIHFLRSLFNFMFYKEVKSIGNGEVANRCIYLQIFQDGQQRVFVNKYDILNAVIALYLVAIFQHHFPEALVTYQIKLLAEEIKHLVNVYTERKNYCLRTSEDRSRTNKKKKL